jgi:hypothetical protein
MRAITIVLAVMIWVVLPAMAGAHVVGLSGVATVAVPVLTAGSAPAAPAKHLTKKHSGWRKTACLGCHDAASLAKHRSPGLQPADCGPCHGYNGAPHEGHAIPINPCGRCHARVEHAATFTSPGDCIKCHVHPKSQQGR